ncbi:MAG: transposase [Nostoc sp.]|uniref:transposase n=1 Tax=Nostoc sp. TaxID=1180 RepID=UPI002FFD350D
MRRDVGGEPDPIEYKEKSEQTKGLVLLKKRWVVERTFGWLMGCRRLVRDYKLLPKTSETFIYLAMIRIMLRRLA